MATGIWPEPMLWPLTLSSCRWPSKFFECTQLKGIPGALRDASPDAWGRREIEHQLERGPADLQELDYLLH